MQKGSRSKKNPNQNLCHRRFVSWSLRPRRPGWPLSPYGRYARDSALTQDKGLLLQEASGITCMFHSHPRVTTQQPLGVTQAAADANLLGWGVDAPPATPQRTCQSGKPGSHCTSVCQNSGPVPWSPPACETQSGTLAGCASTHRVLRETGISSPGGPTACREWGRKQGPLGLAL